MPQLLWYWLYPLTMLTLGLLLIWQALPVSGAVAMLLSLAWLIGMLALWSHLRRQSSTSGAIEVILLGGPEHIACSGARLAQHTATGLALAGSATTTGGLAQQRHSGTRCGAGHQCR
jgi:hypothetical protein